MGLWHKRELDALWQASSFGARHLMLNTRHTGFWVYLLRGPEVHPRRESVYTERPVSAYTGRSYRHGGFSPMAWRKEGENTQQGCP